jgi:hypothetical protein
MVNVFQNIVKENKTKFIEEGEYEGVIVDIEQRENEKGTRWITIGCESAEIGKVYLKFFFTEKAYKRAFRDVQAICREFNLTIDFKELEEREMDYLCDLLTELCGIDVYITVTGSFGNYNYKLKRR